MLKKLKNSWKDDWSLKLAWMLPKRMIFWAAVLVMSHGGDYEPHTRTCGDALEAWED
jgi:hypothetical protein